MPMNGVTKYEVAVTDESIADDQLLELVMSCGDVKVKEFGLKKHSLEEIFVQIMEEENHVR